MIADLYQSAGILPVNVRALNVDFAVGGSVKWLLGGPGAGYLYVRRDLWPLLEPAAIGWQAHRAPFDFEGGPIDYAPDAFRFLGGTPNIPGLYAARAGYQIINEIGVDAIRAKSIRQTTRLIQLADEAGITVRSQRDSARRGGVVILDVPDGERVTAELLRRQSSSIIALAPASASRRTSTPRTTSSSTPSTSSVLSSTPPPYPDIPSSLIS